MRVWHIISFLLFGLIIVLLLNAVMLVTTIGITADVFYHLVLAGTCLGLSYIFFHILRAFYLNGLLKWKDD